MGGLSGIQDIPEPVDEARHLLELKAPPGDVGGEDVALPTVLRRAPAHPVPVPAVLLGAVLPKDDAVGLQRLIPARRSDGGRTEAGLRLHGHSPAPHMHQVFPGYGIPVIPELLGDAPGQGAGKIGHQPAVSDPLLPFRQPPVIGGLFIPLCRIGNDDGLPGPGFRRCRLCGRRLLGMAEMGVPASAWPAPGAPIITAAITTGSICLNFITKPRFSTGIDRSLRSDSPPVRRRFRAPHPAPISPAGPGRAWPLRNTAWRCRPPQRPDHRPPHPYRGCSG